MDIGPTEDELSKLHEALSYLADLISDGLNPNKAALEKILQKVSLNSNHQWIRNILESACPILQRAHDDVDDTERKLIVGELEALGMKSFPAILTYDKAKPKPFSVEPQFVDFGCLKLGKEANATLKVTGGTVKEVLGTKRVKLNLIRTGDGCTLVKVMLSGNSAGESLHDHIVIKGDKDELKVQITALWEKRSEEPILKEPPLLSWCPDCTPKVKLPESKRKTLLYSKRLHKYRCSRCEHEFPYPDKRVNEYNDAHR